MPQVITINSMNPFNPILMTDTLGYVYLSSDTKQAKFCKNM